MRVLASSTGLIEVQAGSMVGSFFSSLIHSLFYSLLHVDVACGFLQAVVADDVGLHGVVTVAILSINELAHARRARPVHLVLVHLLNLLRGVAEHLAILSLLCVLWLGESIV